jgi:hypothetical protein
VADACRRHHKTCGGKTVKGRVRNHEDQRTWLAPIGLCGFGIDREAALVTYDDQSKHSAEEMLGAIKSALEH